MSYPAAVEKALADLQGGDGFVKVIIKEGDASATPKKGQTMVMHYTGTLPDGKKFDSSRDKNKTFSFKLGNGQVIRGWDEGVAQMCKGERAYLVCGYRYAYGESGYPGLIPPRSALVFDVELLDYN